jgi:uncharacterized protein YkwD
VTHSVRRTSRVLLALVGLVMTGLLLTACNSGEEGQEFALLNQTRAANGVPALVRNPTLDAKARAQAVRMARAGRIYHSRNLAGGIASGWTVMGENVGMGGSVASVHQALVGSPAHFANMTDGRFKQVGIGIVARNGVTYVAQVFLGS